MLLYDGQIKYEPVPRTNLDPQDVLRSAIIRAFGRLGTKDDVVHLQKFHEIHGDKGHSDLPAVIRKLGGTVPEKVQEARSSGQPESVPTLNAEEMKSRRAEVQVLLQNVKSGQMSNEQLAKAMSRIGEIGEGQDATPIIEKLAGTNVHWIVRQGAYQALGQLGGAEASDYLIKELQKPMPKDANLYDYGETQAILRSQAALALGGCGDSSVGNILEKIADDDKQYKRVRESCNKSYTRIRERLQVEVK